MQFIAVGEPGQGIFEQSNRFGRPALCRMRGDGARYRLEFWPVAAMPGQACLTRSAQAPVAGCRCGCCLQSCRSSGRLLVKAGGIGSGPVAGILATARKDAWISAIVALSRSARVVVPRPADRTMTPGEKKRRAGRRSGKQARITCPDPSCSRTCRIPRCTARHSPFPPCGCRQSG